MPLQPLQRKCTLYWRLYPSNAPLFLVSTRWGCRHPFKLISMVTVISVSLGAHALAEIYIYIYSVISILWNIYLTNQWMSKSYNKDPLVSRCMFCCNRRKQSLFENLFFMQIYDFSSLWDIHAIFFGDSFSKNR